MLNVAVSELWEGLSSHRCQLASGLTLHYVEQGEGPLVLLLHGFPEYWYSWRHQIPALADAGYRVVAPDMRGYNLSDKPDEVEAYDLERLAEDVAGLVESLGEEEVIVIGHDWGGAAAWFATMLHPERIRRLVILNMPHPVRFAEAMSTVGQRIRSGYFYFFRLRRVASFLFRRFNAFGQRAMLWWFSGRTIRGEELRHYAKAGLQPGAMKASMTYYTALLRRGTTRLSKLVRPISCPVDIIWGDRDPAFGRDLAQPYKEHVPNVSVHYLKGAGHFVQSERHDEVTAKILAVLGP